MAQDVFTIFAELKRRVLGISDQTPEGIKGFIASFMPTGIPINPEDYTKPWKPYLDKAPGETPLTDEEMAVLAKRYESLSNTCTLVDSKLHINEVYQAIKSGASISQAWEIIISGANVMPLPPEQEEFQKKQREKYLPRLRKTIKDEDGEETDVDTKEYKAYKEYQKKYFNAVRDYSMQYMINMSNKQTAQLWGMVGKTYVRELHNAFDEWSALGNKQLIEEALDNLAAMGIDASARMIASAKKKFEMYKVATRGVIPVESSYVEMFPSNWASDSVEGWTEYTYDFSKQTTVTSHEKTAWEGKAGLSLGFWSFKANASRSEERFNEDFSSQKLKISFNYALVEINRPWLDTLLFDLGNWFLLGDYPKGSISNGQMNQVFPDTRAASWLPIIPQYIFVVKNLFIETEDIHNTYNSLVTKTAGGGGFGFGPFNLSGAYGRDTSKSTRVAEEEGEGLRFSGGQILGYVSTLVPLSPKLDAPKDSKQPEELKLKIAKADLKN